MSQTTYRNCTLCEAICGVSVETDANRVLSIRGDENDPLSRGHICPKAHGLKAVYEDRDRLRQPLRRTTDGWQEVSWEEALAEAGERLVDVRRRHGADSIAFYLGNPTGNDGPTILYIGAFLEVLGSNRRYSASSLDQLPKMLANACLFGGNATIAVPDVDRTKYFLMLGANPIVSNGSLMTAPGIKKRLRSLRARGGRLVVVDPRRTETAAVADEHLAIRPAADAFFLFAIVHTLFAEGLVHLGRLAPFTTGVDELAVLAREFSPEIVADATGIEPSTIRRIARDFAAAESAVCYGRVGASVHEFGTLANWLCDVVNVLTGNLDRPGGAMFPTPAIPFEYGTSLREIGRLPYARWRSTVRGLPEFAGELPTATLAEDAEAGAIRALVLHAGNPVLSAPDGARLARALDQLEFVLAIDIYRNETSRHADLILPPTWSLERGNYDLLFHAWSVQNGAKWSPPALPKPEGSRHPWEIFLSLTASLSGHRDAALATVDEGCLRGLVERFVGHASTSTEGISTEHALRELGTTPGPERMIDLLLRIGPYGDAFGKNPGGWNLAKLEEHEHGVDFGPMQPSLPALLTTVSKTIELTHEVLVADVPRLRQALTTMRGELQLIGRRELRSKNSWLHNVAALVKGPERCTLLVHPDDATRLGLVDGGRATVRTAIGQIVAPVEVSDEMRRGVVCLPHGWGHSLEGVELHVATAHPGVPSNFVADTMTVDVPSGNAVLTGIEVQIAAAR
jgi:anaerobic selenocysteine-containing dehydrogenase